MSLSINKFLAWTFVAILVCMSQLTSRAYAAGNEELKNPDSVRQVVRWEFSVADWKSLDELGNRVVRAYEKDPSQFAPLRTFFYFLPDDSDQVTMASYNIWVSQFPNSYAAAYARARYLSHLALDARGSGFIDKVSPDNLDKMDKYFAAASTDLKHSLNLSSRPIMTYFQLIRIARYYSGSNEAWKYYEASARVDPDVLIVAEEYLYTLQPRWGGDFKALQEFPEIADSRGLSASKVVQLKLHTLWLEGRDYDLYGYNNLSKAAYTKISNYPAKSKYKPLALVELAHFAQNQHDYEAAFSYLNRALKEKPNDVRILVELGATARDAKHPQDAIAYYSKAIAIDPNDMGALSGRGWVNQAILGRNEAAYPDMLKSARLGEPVAQNVVGYLYWEGKGIAKNQSEALYWWTLSAKQGNEAAKGNLNMAKGKLGKNFDSTLDAAIRSKQH